VLKLGASKKKNIVEDSADFLSAFAFRRTAQRVAVLLRISYLCHHLLEL
jgi:hypothetical protein